MKLVEVIRGLRTSDESFKLVKEVSEDGKDLRGVQRLPGLCRELNSHADDQ